MTCFRNLIAILSILALPIVSLADEIFVTIQKVNGNRMLVVKDDAGRGMRGGGEANGQTRGQPRRRGRRGGATTNSRSVTVTVPAAAKITSAMRERRTFEFRVLGELPGGLRNRVFLNMPKPLQARMVTNGNLITEVNVISGESDINQTSTNATGQSIIAVRPKRPPTKRKP